MGILEIVAPGEGLREACQDISTLELMKLGGWIEVLWFGERGTGEEGEVVCNLCS